MNRVQILHIFLINGTDLSESKCSQLSGARPVLDFYTLVYTCTTVHVHVYLVTGTGPGMYKYNVLSMAAILFFAFMLFFSFIGFIRFSIQWALHIVNYLLNSSICVWSNQILN